MEREERGHPTHATTTRGSKPHSHARQSSFSTHNVKVKRVAINPPRPHFQTGNWLPSPRFCRMQNKPRGLCVLGIRALRAIRRRLSKDSQQQRHTHPLNGLMFLWRDMNHRWVPFPLFCPTTQLSKKFLGILSQKLSQSRVTGYNLLDHLLEASGVLFHQLANLVHLWHATAQVECSSCTTLGSLLLLLLGKLERREIIRRVLSQIGHTWNRFWGWAGWARA